MRIYLGSAPVIYFVEQSEEFREAVNLWIGNTANQLVVSDLTRMECRVKPIQESDDPWLESYDSFFDSAEKIALTSIVVDLATVLRAHYKYDIPDALHAASAVASGSDVLLTTDHALASFREVTVELIDACIYPTDSVGLREGSFHENRTRHSPLLRRQPQDRAPNGRA